ncbi:MAG: ATP-grasp domain-containing protein [Ferrimicrobium sp.]
MSHILLILPSSSYRSDTFFAAAYRQASSVSVVTDAEVPSAQGVFVLESLNPDDDAYDALLARLITLPIDAVVGVDEPSVALASRLSDSLSLTTDALRNTQTATDKALLRRRLAQSELPQPRFEIRTSAECQTPSPDLVASIDTALGGFPLVVKPAKCTASRGVIRADDRSQLGVALEIASTIAGSDANVVIEEYIAGEEFALEGIFANRVLDVIAIFEKPDIGEGPYFWEKTYIGPARLDPRSAIECTLTVERGARALELGTTPIHAELRRDDHGVFKLLEIAPRTIGGRCSSVLNFTDGSRLEDHVIAAAFGGAPRPKLRSSPFGVYMIPTPQSGVLDAIDGVEVAAAVPYITEIQITTPLGATVFAPPFTDRYLGFIFATAPTHAMVAAALAAAVHQIRVLVSPMMDPTHNRRPSD